MAIPSVYINLEDDVSKVVDRLKHNPAQQVILVFPKRSFLFSDKINLKLLKKQIDLLGKEAFVLTMDEKGQLYAREAGFSLKFLPKMGTGKPLSDIKFAQKKVVSEEASVENSSTPVEAPVKPVQAVRRQPAAFRSIQAEVSKEAQKNIVSPLIINSEIPVVQMDAAKPDLEIKDVIFPEGESEEAPPAKKINFPKTVLIFSLASIILILLLNFVVLPKATVLIYPKTEPVTRDMEISMSVGAQAIDPNKLILPAFSINQTVTATSTFQSNGKNQVGNKSQGSVKIYNFTKLPINLKVQTTTLTLGSKTYHLVDDVLGIKPTTYKNAKTKEVNPDSLSADVQIIASTGGDDFNLPAGTRVEITNQVFGSKPQLLYAVTSSEITGGTTRYLSVISADDVAAAKKQLEDQALAELRSTLSAQGQVLADRAFNFNVTQFTTDNPQGAQTPSFGAVLSAQISGLSFKKADLDNLISQRITQNLSGNKTLQPSQNTQTTYSAKSLDLNNNVGVLTVHYQGQAVYNVDLGNLAPELVSKSQNDVNEILRSKAAIDKVEITLAPSWQKNFPIFANKINLTVVTPQ